MVTTKKCFLRSGKVQIFTFSFVYELINGTLRDNESKGVYVCWSFYSMNVCGWVSVALNVHCVGFVVYFD